MEGEDTGAREDARSPSARLFSQEVLRLLCRDLAAYDARTVSPTATPLASLSRVYPSRPPLTACFLRSRRSTTGSTSRTLC